MASGNISLAINQDEKFSSSGSKIKVENWYKLVTIARR
jgi:hypothetical protein